MELLALDLSPVVPVAVFGVFSAVAWLMLDRMLGKRKVEERLEQLGGDWSNSAAPEAERRSSAVVAMLVEKASPQLARPLQPTSQRDAFQLTSRLSHAGFRTEAALPVFLALKIVCVLAGFFLGGGAVFFSLGFTPTALLRACIVTLTAFFVPDAILYLIRRRRQQGIFLGLPDALDLMVVCVEAGLGLDQAMRNVSVEMRKTFPVIAHEMELANMQLQMGWSRVQVLRDLGTRNGEDDLRALASVLIHATKFGTGVGTALRVQSDAMRVKRRQIAEEKAAKSAVKLIFPLVLFIFPGIFVVLVGPAAISIIRTLLPTMNT